MFHPVGRKDMEMEYSKSKPGLFKQGTTMLAGDEFGEYNPGILDPFVTDKKESLLTKVMKEIESSTEAQMILKSYKPIWTPNL